LLCWRWWLCTSVGDDERSKKSRSFWRHKVEIKVTKLQKILLGLFVLQIILVGAVFWPRQTAVAEPQPLFTNLNVADLNRVVITDENGESLEFVREGEDWVLPAVGNYPANSQRLEEALGKLTAVQTNRLIARTADSQKRLQVADDDFLRRLSLTRADGTVETLFVGSSPNAQGSHVRRGGETETYLTDAIQSWELTPQISSWIDTTYIALTADDVNEVIIENENGRLDFTRNADNEWQLAGLAEGQEFNQTAFTTVLNQLVNLHMNAPLGTAEQPNYGLDNPQATVTLVTADDTSTLLIGAKDEATTTYTAKWSGSDYYVTISAFSADKLVMATPADYIQEPTPPAEAITPTPES
jgi:hypothetical protein